MKRFRLAEYSVAAALLLIAGWGWSHLWADVIAPARQAARRTQFRHDLFQHSGWHPVDVVRLDKEHRVVSVGSCPACTGTIAPVEYVTLDGTTIRESKLQFETVFDARQALLHYKSKPRYRRLSESMRSTREQILRFASARAIPGIPID